MSDGNPRRARLLRNRFWLYGVLVLALLVFRIVPGMRSRLSGMTRASAPSPSALRVAGLDTAPELIPRLVSEYRRIYPKVKVETLPGGTIRALEDLVNHRADVAFLSRDPSPEERAIIRSTGDSVMAFPIALGGTVVLASRSAKLESLSVDALRQVLQGKRPALLGPPGEGAVRVFVPDPSSGLWGAITKQLAVSDTAALNVVWLADQNAVASAVEKDPASIGLASSLDLPPEGGAGWRLVPVIGAHGAPAARPTSKEIAVGDYPLHHHLYVSCLTKGDVLAAGFVSFVHGEHGQVFIRREGFLPAREIAREIQLAQRPVGMPR